MVAAKVKDEMRGIRKSTKFIRDLWTDLFSSFASVMVEGEKMIGDNMDELVDAAKLADRGIELWEERWK